MKYVSFDIFDTCLVRRCGDAENVFFLLARRLFGDDTTEAEMFFHWRCWAENSAVNRLGEKNVSIDDIYEGIPNYILRQYDIESLIKEELNLESEMLRAIPSTLKIIEERRNEGEKIVFISDMYLSSSFLFDILLREGIAKKDDLCFVSCECKKSKASGKIYSYVTNYMGGKPLCHYGDNLWSDIKKAKENGINSRLLSNGFNKTEKYILRRMRNNRNFHLYSCLVGTMRFGRLKNTQGLSPDLSSDFVAPMFTAYVLACLRKAQHDKMDRLYFLARDGYILLWIAKHFSSYFPSIDLKYLYVSRKSMYLPSLSSVKAEEIERYFADNFKYTTKEQRLSYFKQATWDENVVLRQAKKARERIDKYFEKNGVYDENVKYALVDVGWKGSGKFAFNQLLKQKGYAPREMWYWGTFKEWRMSFDGDFWTYNINMDLPMYFITMVEDFFSTSPNLSTIDYEDGEPVFDEKSKIDNADVLEMNKLCLNDFISMVKEFRIDNQNILDELSLVCCNVLKNHPEYVDLRPLLTMKCFSEKGNGKGLINTPHLIDVLKYVMGSNSFTGWIEGNMAYSCKMLLNFARCARKISMFIRNKKEDA